jgi:hypothetical protein
MGHLRCNSTTGKLMRSMVDYTQLECRCTGNVLEQDYGRYSSVIMIENWLTAIWEHLHSCNSNLNITAKWKSQTNHQNDIAVMEALTETGNFSGKDLKKSTAAGYTFGSSTSPIYPHSTGKESQPGHGREYDMEGGNHPGHGQFNNGQPLGKHGHWHLNT